MEGPSLVILKEELKPFIGEKIKSASGLAAIEYQKITGQNFTTSRRGVSTF